MGGNSAEEPIFFLTTVENNNGIELPATGDMGTIIFSVVDEMLIIGSTIIIIVIQHNHNISVF